MPCKLKETIFLSAWKRCKNRRYCTMLQLCIFNADFVFHILLLLLSFDLMDSWLLFFKGSVGETKQSAGGAAQRSQVSGEERNPVSQCYLVAWSETKPSAKC